MHPQEKVTKMDRMEKVFVERWHSKSNRAKFGQNSLLMLYANACSLVGVDLNPPEGAVRVVDAALCKQLCRNAE